MKKLAYILVFVTGMVNAQRTVSNKPKLAKKLTDSFVEMAEARGIEVRERLYSIDKILFLPGAENSHSHKDGICSITIGVQLSDSIHVERALFHEIGHHFGLNDCRECTYNIMTWYASGKTNYLYSDAAIRALYLDLYFEGLRNPKKYNNGHTHY